MQPDRLLPLSILLGGAFIGSGLYFGLREREGPSVTAVAVTASAPPPRAAPAPQPDYPALQEIVARQAAQALEAQRPDMVRACWAPAVAKTPQPAAATYRYNLSFDAEGRQVSLGISEIRGQSRTDVAVCLRSRPLALQIAPPRVVVNVDVPVTLP